MRKFFSIFYNKFFEYYQDKKRFLTYGNDAKKS